jgi:hypothetical protein
VLEDDGGLAGEVADKLQALADLSYGRLVFDDVGPAMGLDGDYVCFHIPGLRLPRTKTPREEQLREELLRQAILYLVTAFSDVCCSGTPPRSRRTCWTRSTPLPPALRVASWWWT